MSIIPTRRPPLFPAFCVWDLQVNRVIVPVLCLGRAQSPFTINYDFPLFHLCFFSFFDLAGSEVDICPACHAGTVAREVPPMPWASLLSLPRAADARWAPGRLPKCSLCSPALSRPESFPEKDLRSRTD